MKKRTLFRGQKPVLVCVTAQKRCDRLIKAGRMLADELDVPLELLSVQPVDAAPDERAAALECLYALSKNAGADIMTYYSDDPVLTVAAHAKNCHARHIITGTPSPSDANFITPLHALVPDIPLTMVDPEGGRRILLPETGKRGQRLAMNGS